MRTLFCRHVLSVVLRASPLLFVASAFGQIFGTQSADFGGSGRGLYNINPANLFQPPTFVGDIGAATAGLSFNPANGLLYGSTGIISVNTPTPAIAPPGSLIMIDPVTGHSSFVGSFGLSAGMTLADLTFSPSGVLYGWSSGSNGDLYTVNIATGAATLVGESGLTGLSGGGLPSVRAACFI